MVWENSIMLDSGKNIVSIRQKQHLSFLVKPVIQRTEYLLFLTLFHWCRFTPDWPTFPWINDISTSVLCIWAWGRWLTFHLFTSGWTQGFFCCIWNFRQDTTNVTELVLSSIYRVVMQGILGRFCITWVNSPSQEVNLTKLPLQSWRDRFLRGVIQSKLTVFIITVWEKPVYRKPRLLSLS